VRLENKIGAFIHKHELLSPGDGVLVAVSGGPDSVALLRVLYELRQEFALHLEVAHLQHGIRGEEARKDVRFVGELAESLKLPFHLKEINLLKMKSAATKGNLEAMAREERYEFFAAVARERGIGKVATAHTRDDQAETVVMWLLRGCGMRGLGGMSPMRRLRAPDPDPVLIRPLLGVSKAEVVAFLDEKRINYRVDPSNQDPNLLRNWIRFRLFPQLKERIDPQLPARLAHEAELIRDEDHLLQRLAEEKLASLRGSKGIDQRLFISQDKAMQRRVMRLWLEETRGHLRGIAFDHVETLVKLATEGPAQSRLSIPGGWEFVKEYETLRLEERSDDIERACYSYELSIGGELTIVEAGITIRSEHLSAPLASLPRDLMEAVFDSAGLPTTLTVRSFRDGDRFRPLGMTGRKKVKDLFIEKKVPLSVRAILPLVSIGQEILWIPGYGRSEIGRIHPQTSSILHLTAVPLIC
jgi:tRNA(Ile)-lysidine synthase